MGRCIQRISVLCQGHKEGEERLLASLDISTKGLQDWQEVGCVFGEQVGPGTPVNICHVA